MFEQRQRRTSPKIFYAMRSTTLNFLGFDSGDSDSPWSIVATFPDFCWLVTMNVACSRLQDSKESGSRKVARKLYEEWGEME